MAFNIPQSPENPFEEKPKNLQKEESSSLDPDKNPKPIPKNDPFLQNPPTTEETHNHYAGSFQPSPDSANNPYAPPAWESTLPDENETSYGDGDGKIHPLQALKNAFTTFKSSIWISLLTTFLILFGSGLSQEAIQFFKSIVNTEYILATALVMLLGQIISSIWLNVFQGWAIQQTRGNLEFPNLPTAQGLLRFILVQIVQILSVAITAIIPFSIILLTKANSNPLAIAAAVGFTVIVSGYFVIRLSFATFYAIDPTIQKPGVKKSLISSWQATRGNLLAIVGMILLLLATNFAGVLLLGIGLLASLPITMFAYAIAYQQISNRSTPTT